MSEDLTKYITLVFTLFLKIKPENWQGLYSSVCLGSCWLSSQSLKKIPTMNVTTRWHNTALMASYDSVTLWHCDNVTWPSTEMVGETVLIKHEDFDVEGASDNTWSNIWVLSPGLSCPAMTVKVCHDSPLPPSLSWLAPNPQQSQVEFSLCI